jgi:hypothetical protein
VPSLEQELTLTNNQPKVIRFFNRKTTQPATATLSQASNEDSKKEEIKEKYRITIKPDQATHWTEELSPQSQGLALAKTYARIVEMGGYVGA